jgi:ABC-type dipeptide/oligopeptide/nickel transport system permease subunit
MRQEKPFLPHSVSEEGMTSTSALPRRSESNGQQSARSVRRFLRNNAVPAWSGRLATHRPGVIAGCVLIMVVLATLVGPALWGVDAFQTDFGALRAGPGPAHPFGADALGRDLLARLMIGGRTSLAVAFVSQLVTMSVAIAIGLCVGFIGRWLDQWTMRTIDVLLALPDLLLVILLVPVLTAGLGRSIGPNWLIAANEAAGGAIGLVLAMVLTGWMTSARLVRGQVLSLRETEFVLAARVIGASSLRIMFHHLLPNLVTVIVVAVTLGVPRAVLLEAGISFLGLGITPPMPSWGNLVSEGVEVMRSYPHLLLAPSAAIAVTVVSLNVLGDGVRDALDPRTYHG